MNVSLGEVSAWCGGKTVGGETARLTGVSTDTRTLSAGELFVAIRGPQHDGHSFLEQAAARGMRISMPHPQSGDGTVDLIGNPLKLSRTPVSYRRSPPTCGADTEDTIREILGEQALADARTSGVLG